MAKKPAKKPVDISMDSDRLLVELPLPDIPLEVGEGVLIPLFVLNEADHEKLAEVFKGHRSGYPVPFVNFQVNSSHVADTEAFIDPKADEEEEEELRAEAG